MGLPLVANMFRCVSYSVVNVLSCALPSSLPTIVKPVCDCLALLALNFGWFIV